MERRLADLRNKEVINILDGSRLGCVTDVGLDIESARATHLVIDDRPRFLGLFAHGNAMVIPWEEIETIGEETILVRYIAPPGSKSKGGWLWSAFREK